MSDESPLDEQPGPSTSMQRSSSIGETTTTPKKGILKRSSLRTPNQGETRDTLFPLPHRPSPDRFPDKAATRIPKLSVTWWEKNAVAVFGDTSDENNTDSEQVLKDLGSGPRRKSSDDGLRQTAILDSEEDFEDVLRGSTPRQETTIDDVAIDRDDAMSIASSTGSASSSVVGRWWTGKDTRFVPHCQKRGCNHAHHGGNSDLGEYLTPTQRRNKEMNELKKDLRMALNERDEKDRHLEELREKLKEMESLSDIHGNLTDSHKFMQREREIKDGYEREKKQTEKRHGVRVNQLVQETLAAREEIVRLNARIRELENILSRPRTETSTLTDPIQYATPAVPIPPASPTAAPTDPTSFTQGMSPQPVENPLSPVHSLPDQSISRPSQIPLYSPMSVSVDSRIGGQQMYMSQEALNHVQACQNEAFIWRTKAAQLELVIKDQLLKASDKEMTMRRELDAARSEVENMRRSLGMSPPSTSVPVQEEAVQVQQEMELPPAVSPHRLSPRSVECVDPSCLERKKSLISENNQLLETVEEVNMRIRELEEDVTSIRSDYDSLEEEKNALEARLLETSNNLQSKIAEVAACNIVITRIQGEKDTMQKAISYMEERMQVYQNTLMDNDLIISDEAADNWRKGVTDPRYSVMVSKRVQTMLTAEELSLHENEFQSTKRKLTEITQEFTSKRSDLHGRFEEIEKILETKTELVDMLTRQLEETRKSQRSEIDRHQEEREQYKRSLNELSQVAEKVPLLETRIEQLLQEKSAFELRFAEQKEEFENGLNDALGEALKKYKEQSTYWKDKVHSYEVQLEKSRNEISQLVREREEQKIKNRLERADLEQRLTSSIDHVSSLNKQMNKSQRDAECEAKPRHVSKYVACRPNVKSKSTIIEKGDLFNESDERLKLCQGELATTRRQVHVLQQKLITTIQEKSASRMQVRRRIACVVDRPESTDEKQEKDKGNEESAEKIESLQTRNAELREKVTQIEEEKAALVSKEKERIQHLATEFDNVRKELDQEMSRYESEKKWLKSRIRNLEIDNEQLQRQLEKSDSPPAKEKEAKIAGSGDTANARTKRNLPRISVAEEDRVTFRKTLSEPELGFDEEETAKLRAENLRLISELERVRESIRRTASAASAASRNTARSQLSPAFANLADDLSMVKNDLEQILCNMDDDKPSKEVEKTKSKSETPRADSLRSRLTPANDDMQSQILDQVMLDWEADEKESLARDLKRSRLERDTLKSRFDRLASDLNTVKSELEVYRREPRHAESEGAGNLKRSKSVVDLNTEIDREETQRWKEKCGTMFRELNRMRKEYGAAMDERRELKIQLTMMRGELELTRCQIPSQPHPAMTTSEHIISKSARGDSSGSIARLHEDVIVHESPAAFRKGSTRESLACTIGASPTRRRRSVDSRRDETGRDTRERTRSMRDETGDARERTRSRSGQRKKLTSSKDELEAMEERRRSRKSLSHYATAPQSVSSSMTSLQNIPSTSQQQNIQNVLKKPPIMSQSWHESLINRSKSTNDVILNQNELEEEERRQNTRVISLREKVGRLTQENKQLQEEMEAWKNKASSLEVQSGYRSGIDVNRLNRLEEEKEVLKEQVEKLLLKIQNEESAKVPDPSDLYLREQLTLSRQENEMYERKIREMEEERREMYLVMFKKGQQAATMDLKEEKSVDQMTQDRIVLKFLHDAFYYFLTNKGDSKEHLQAIMTMLDFSVDQKEDVIKKRGKSH